MFNAGQKYCRMLKGSILQYFCPALSNNQSLENQFLVFLSGRLRQVLMYIEYSNFTSVIIVLFRYMTDCLITLDRTLMAHTVA